MGRTPCCDADGLNRGPWTREEDQKLLAYIQQHGCGSWRFLPRKAGLQRCGKSCRLRWNNYLRPDIKRGEFSLLEDRTIIQLHALLGNRWSAIAAHLPKRTDNEIKNYWNTRLKKRLAMMGIDPVTHKPISTILGSANGDPKNASTLSHMAQWESARLEAEARLVRESQLCQYELPGSSGSIASSGMLLNETTTALAPPRCLDVLKAWESLMLESMTESRDGGGICDIQCRASALGFLESARAVSSTVGSLDFCRVLGGDLNEIFTTHLYNMATEVGDGLFNNLDNHNLSTDSLITSSGRGSNAEVRARDEKNYWNDIINLGNYGLSNNLPVL